MPLVPVPPFFPQGPVAGRFVERFRPGSFLPGLGWHQNNYLGSDGIGPPCTCFAQRSFGLFGCGKLRNRPTKGMARMVWRTCCLNMSKQLLLNKKLFLLGVFRGARVGLFEKSLQPICQAAVINNQTTVGSKFGIGFSVFLL